MKQKINVLVNPSVDNKSYIDFLSTEFEINVINYDKNLPILEEIDLVLFTGGEDVYPKYYYSNTNPKTKYNESRDKIESNMFNSVSRNTFKLGICRGSQFITVKAGGRLVQHVNNHTSPHSISVIRKYCKNTPNENSSIINGVDINNINVNTLPLMIRREVEAGRITLAMGRSLFLEQLHRDNIIRNNIFNDINNYESTNYVEMESTSTHHQMMYPYVLRKEDYEIIAHSTYFLSDVYEDSSINDQYEIQDDFLEPEIVYYLSHNSLGIQGHPEFATANPVFKETCLNIIKTKLNQKIKKENE